MACERNHQAGGRLGKIDRPRTLPTCEGGYKPFKIGELFEKITTKRLGIKVADVSKNKTDEQDLPALTAGIINQGLVGFVSRQNATILKNVISVSANGANTGAMFYQPHEFTVLQDGYAIRLKGSNNIGEKVYLYLIACLQKSVRGFYDWSNKAGWEKIRHLEVTLPTTATGDIDFAFIEERVRELEEERVRELEAYLKAAGFEDCTLNAAECEALSNFSGEIHTKEFKISELFELHGNPQLNKDSFRFGKDSVYPYFTRTVFNNGILGYVDYLDDEHLVKGNSLAVGMMGMQFFYMEHDFYAGQFTKTAFPKFSCFNETLALWFITWLNKSSRTYKDVLVRDFEKTFYNTDISLPITADGAIDYAFMETAVRAMEKQCIARLKAAFAREHEAYMQVIS